MEEIIIVAKVVANGKKRKFFFPEDINFTLQGKIKVEKIAFIDPELSYFETDISNIEDIQEFMEIIGFLCDLSENGKGYVRKFRTIYEDLNARSDDSFLEIIEFYKISDFFIYIPNITNAYEYGKHIFNRLDEKSKEVLKDYVAYELLGKNRAIKENGFFGTYGYVYHKY